MFVSKPLASLSSGLLARKGHARPAMRPQPISFGMAAGGDDLGWNDMGDSAGNDAGAPVPPVLIERAELVCEIEAPASAETGNAAQNVSPATVARLVRESAVTGTRKAAFTLRLEPDRHLRLRLASALAGRSAQQLVTEALDAFLSHQPGLDALVDRLPKPNR